MINVYSSDAGLLSKSGTLPLIPELRQAAIWWLRKWNREHCQFRQIDCAFADRTLSLLLRRMRENIPVCIPMFQSFTVKIAAAMSIGQCATMSGARRRVLR